MGVKGITDAIRRYGAAFRGLPGQEPALPREPQLTDGGQLSAGLAAVANQKATAAAQFAAAKDKGTVAAGDGLIRIAGDLDDFDQRGADAIRQLFPGGGR